MTSLLRTVRAKLLTLVALPLVLTAVMLPIQSAVLHRELMAAADDHVEDAERSFQIEFDDDLTDLQVALRIMVAHPATRPALLSGNPERALEVAKVFSGLYPGIDIVLAKRDGRVLADVGPTDAPASLPDIPELRNLPDQGEIRAVLSNGCSKPSVRSPPSRIVASSVAGDGWIVVCNPLDLAYVENAARKLGIEMAMLDGSTQPKLVASTKGFPAPALHAAGEQTSLLDVDDKTWAIQRFAPRLSQGTRGGTVGIVAAADVTNISVSVHKSLQIALIVVLLLAAVFLVLGGTIAARMSRALRAVIDAFTKLEQQQYVRVPVLHTRDEIERLASGFNHMVDGLAERDKLKTTFGKYMTQSVIDHLLAGKIALGGETLTVTILFSDIRSFTSISESMSAQTLVGLLNDYFTEMVSIVIRHNGAVDKYIGDAIMAVFGAPVPGPNDAENAVRAAVQMRAALERVNQRLIERGLPALRTGIGIHTGEVVAGNIGSEQRMEYTVIGDAVNLASRLESNTKELGVDVLISQSTYDLTKNVIRSRAVKEITVKGRAQPVMTYEVLGIAESKDGS